jgi:lipopolysaccharide export system permease protein
MNPFWTSDAKLLFGMIILLAFAITWLMRVRLYKLLIKSFIGPFIGTFFVALFLFLMQTIWKYLEDLVGKGLELAVIFEFIFYFAIHLIPMALPLAILLSSIMVFGSLAEKYELVAIKSAGVSLLKAMRPMFLISFTLAIAAFFTANYLIPKANLSWGALLYDVTQKKPAMNIVDNVFFKDIPGYQIRVGKKHDDGQTIEDILIYIGDRTNEGNNNILIAEKGKMSISRDKQYMTLNLINGKRYQELVDDANYRSTMPHNTMAFESYNLTLDLSDLAFNRTDKERFSEDQRMMNVEQLGIRIDSLTRYIHKKRESLYRYMDPYFIAASDTIELKDTSVFTRFEYLMNTLKNENNLLASTVDEFNSFDTLKSKFPAPLRIADREKKNPKKTRSIQAKYNRREQIIERALQTTNNINRISTNNIDDSSSQRELRARYLVEWHRKFTLAVSCILLFFIGAPLGAIIKKGGFGLPLVISLLLFILYYVVTIFGEKLAKQGVLPPVLGMWLALMLFFPLAIFLTYKASRDSQLFNADAYKKIIRLLTPYWAKEYLNKK